jgi:hypothetical protein
MFFTDCPQRVGHDRFGGERNVRNHLEPVQHRFSIKVDARRKRLMSYEDGRGISMEKCETPGSGMPPANYAVQRTFSISLLWVFAGKHWLPSRLCLA